MQSADLSPAALAARIVARYPHLARPVDAALQLVESGCVSGNDIHTKITDGDGTIYDQDYHERTGTWTCNCPDYRYPIHVIYSNNFAIIVCKHVLARAIAERAGLIEAQS